MKPRLALSMIVRDAAADLPKCLASVAGVVDEIVIADTGSRDETMAIARAHGARLTEFAWSNDFAAARNHSLEQVHADWVLVLDADERLDHGAGEAIHKAIAETRAAGFLVTIRNYLNSLQERVWDQPALPNHSALEEARPYPAYVDHQNVRLFRRTAGIYFTGRVHETVGTRIQQAGGTLEIAGFLIHHFGLAADAQTRERKNQAYRGLGWQKVKDNPGDAQAFFEIGLMEFDVYRNDRTALECFVQASRLNPRLSVAWFFAGLTSLRLGEYKQARGFLSHADQLGHSPALVNEALGDASYNEGDFASAAQHYQIALTAGENAELHSKLGLAEVRQGSLTQGWERMLHAVAAKPELPEIYDRLIAAAVWAGDLQAAASSAEQKIVNCELKPEYFLRAASIRSQLQDLSAARTILQLGHETFPAHERLATCFHELSAIQ